MGRCIASPAAFTTNFHGVVLGIAHRALDEVTEIAGSKVLMPQGVAIREVQHVRAAHAYTLARGGGHVAGAGRRAAAQ